MHLFRSILGNSFLVRTSLLLFLNKKDVFLDKLEHVPLTVCFPNYKGNNKFKFTFTIYSAIL